MILLAVVLAASSANPVVKISTSMGDIKVQLDRKKAPISVDNFLHYVAEKHYDGTIFHRVIPKFMIQGGGFDKNLAPVGKAQPPIKNEAGNGLKNLTGTIAMARTNIVDSATDQFYLNVHDNGFLDHRDDSREGDERPRESARERGNQRARNPARNPACCSDRDDVSRTGEPRRRHALHFTAGLAAGRSAHDAIRFVA